MPSFLGTFPVVQRRKKELRSFEIGYFWSPVWIRSSPALTSAFIQCEDNASFCPPVSCHTDNLHSILLDKDGSDKKALSQVVSLICLYWRTSKDTRCYQFKKKKSKFVNRIYLIIFFTLEHYSAFEMWISIPFNYFG